MDRAYEHLALSDDELILDDPELLLAEEEGNSVDIAWENAGPAPQPRGGESAYP